MRLICPNCNAEYEIPADAIPATGRDLQCSSCGVTWFSKPPEADSETTGDLSQVLVPQPATDATNKTEAAAAPRPAPGSDIPPLDTAIADVLRQEAAAEVKLRSQDAACGLESQPDLGLDSADRIIGTEQRHARESRERIERMRSVSEQTDPSAQTQAKAAPLRDKASSSLPDVDTLGSSLRATDSSTDDSNSPTPSFYRQAGFSSGFVFILIIAAVLTGIYVQAGYITQLVPDLTEPLNQYQTAVDAARVWLDQQTDQAVALFRK